jgi:hypothetical protein
MNLPWGSCSAFAHVGGFVAESKVVARSREEIDHLGAREFRCSEQDPLGRPVPTITQRPLAACYYSIGKSGGQECDYGSS